MEDFKKMTSTKFTAEMNHIWRGTALDSTHPIRRKLDRQQKNCESGVE